ncbi:restriction endonuclease subunit M [Mycoplasma feriruminatoris]|uniref:restriction endonuclease subunit M n=1 Tax=Mycoplasma feriruminatoris TaxID=1179777 RepID=UPI00030A1826|nr:restriction endonuclease subunit M [Mycoplasma feriruminatoris]
MELISNYVSVPNKIKKKELNIKEFYKNNIQILKNLLIDRTTNENIIYATDSYRNLGYKFKTKISLDNLLKENFITIRNEKTHIEKLKRTKNKAEVFTPSFICNKQNNLIDNAWFGYENAFNFELADGWKVNNKKIKFINEKTYLDYIKDKRLEITCGEAPYLVSRYDTVTGKNITINRRIGLLDRKFRIINENYTSKENWIELSLLALKSIYGYEWQGDNLFLARQNILFSYIDYYKNQFNEDVAEPLLYRVSEIISYNIFQMDGLRFVIPGSCKITKLVSHDIFGEEKIIKTQCNGCSRQSKNLHDGIYVKVMDWSNNKFIEFRNIK